MGIIHIIIGLVLIIFLLELIKHLFFKKTAKLVMILFTILVLFLAFSYTFKNIETFQDNKLIRTGSVVAEEIVDFLKGKVDTEAIVNSTVKSNKLFKP